MCAHDIKTLTEYIKDEQKTNKHALHIINCKM